MNTFISQNNENIVSLISFQCILKTRKYLSKRIHVPGCFLGLYEGLTSKMLHLSVEESKEKMKLYVTSSKQVSLNTYVTIKIKFDLI